jgi:XTP/dITP diphosphohydrolase
MIMDKRLSEFKRLLDIMDDLREKCPWDKKQTLDSLRHLTIEETYELCDAIIENDLDELKGEIGDLLLHMVFYSKIASEKKAFDIADVLKFVCDKLVHRHPHIYGDVKAETEDEVKANWEKIKLTEKGKGGERKTVLQGVPKSLPSLVKAVRIQDKVKGVGFEWEKKEQVWAKVEEEIKEFQEEELKNDITKMEQEYGDVLFSLVNYGRFIGINPEDALEKTNKKFINRFTEMENSIHASNQDMKSLSLDEMNKHWEEAKKHLDN